MVRVIAGTCRSRKLKTLDSEATKPTLDRVKEAMFSIISDAIPGAVVFDVFAGNGSLGIEALSRGAERCVFCDISGDCIKIIKENVATLELGSRSEVIKGDFKEAVNSLIKKNTVADVLLLDPPYRKGLIEKALTAKGIEKICHGAGENVFPPEKTIALCEHAKEEILPEQLGDFRKIKTKSYGTVGLTLYEYCGE